MSMSHTEMPLQSLSQNYDYHHQVDPMAKRRQHYGSYKHDLNRTCPMPRRERYEAPTPNYSNPVSNYSHHYYPPQQPYYHYEENCSSGYIEEDFDFVPPCPTSHRDSSNHGFPPHPPPPSSYRPPFVTAPSMSHSTRPYDLPPTRNTEPTLPAERTPRLDPMPNPGQFVLPEYSNNPVELPFPTDSSLHPELSPHSGSQQGTRSSESPVSSPGGELRELDIVCGRGAPTNYHYGNQVFKEIIQEHQTAYLCAKRSNKPQIAMKILSIVKESGARFVRREKAAGRFCWVEIDSKGAYEKACQALRDGAPDLQRKLLSSIKKKELAQKTNNYYEKDDKENGK